VSPGVGWQTAPGDTIQGVTPERHRKIVAEFRKNTAQTMSEDGSCDETTAKKGHHFAEGDE